MKFRVFIIWGFRSALALVALTLGYTLFMVLVQTYSQDLSIPEKLIGASAGAAAFVVASMRVLFDERYVFQLRRCAGLFYAATIGLFASTAFKLVLYRYWGVGDFFAGFSSDFKLAPSSFLDIGSRGHGFLAYSMFFCIVLSCFLLLAGAWQLLIVFFPSLSKVHRPTV